LIKKLNKNYLIFIFIYIYLYLFNLIYLFLFNLFYLFNYLLGINNINESHSKQPLHHHHHHTSQYEEKRFKRARNNSNTSEASNLTSTSTVTTETTTTTTSGITNENEHYQDDNTYSELLNNPMKKHEIYQMERSHNTFIKSWLDIENKIYTNLNNFIENDFIDLYNFLCQVS